MDDLHAAQKAHAAASMQIYLLNSFEIEISRQK